jgi:3-methyladenine DNA glycosylase Mpg
LSPARGSRSPEDYVAINSIKAASGGCGQGTDRNFALYMNVLRLYVYQMPCASTSERSMGRGGGGGL